MTDTDQTPAGADTSSGFVVNFDWTQEDELRSLAVVTRVLFNPAKQIDRMVIILGGIATILFMLQLLIAKTPPVEALLSGTVFIPGLAALMLLLYRVSKGKRAGENTTHMTELIKQRGLPASMIGPMQVTLAPPGITIINRDYSRSCYDWSAITDITIEDGYFMLHALWMVYIRIPDHAFASPGERDAASSACKQWMHSQHKQADNPA